MAYEEERRRFWANESAYTTEFVYTIVVEDGSYRITKFDNMFNPLRSYYIYQKTWNGRELCTCQFGLYPTCRHRDMLHIFLSMHRVNSGWFYNYYDGKRPGKWERPLNDPVRIINQKRGVS